jgi:hypothetical protein
VEMLTGPHDEPKVEHCGPESEFFDLWIEGYRFTLTYPQLLMLQRSTNGAIEEYLKAKSSDKSE